MALFYLITGMVLTACGQKNFDEKLQSLYSYTIPLIQPSELEEAKKSGNNIYLLDIRTSEEFAVSHLEDARFIDYDNFNMTEVQNIPKDGKVVLYCAVGYRSERVGEKLKAAGYEDVSNLYGGIFQWKNEGYPVVNQQRQPTVSVHTYNKNWSQWLERGIKVY
jgi:rhodanese-related sulfurtransferase